MNYQLSRKEWHGNQKFGLGYNQKQEGYGEDSIVATRGPRARRTGNPLEDGKQRQNIHKDLYNLEEFQADYENAKFFIIKSYNEDDIHKSIKYNVWSSTPRGNEKLDNAFRDAEAKAAAAGTKHPVFLLFSVNGSGQFVGAAEMTGQVDFNKSMDFWQVDKWKGFFPVRWHIIKDLPNRLFHHIILENNDFKTVTHSRDTQEVGQKHGLEMLSIFKSYSAKTSLLDDFDFYENRQRSLKAKRFHQSALRTNDIQNERKLGAQSATYSTDPMSSLVDRTKNLRL